MNSNVQEIAAEVMKKARDRWLSAPVKKGVSTRCAIRAIAAETRSKRTRNTYWTCYSALLLASKAHSLIVANDSGNLTKEHWDKAIEALGGKP